MCRRVARRVEVALYHLACLQVDDDHVFGLHLIVADAAGLDDHETFLTVDARHIAPGEDDQSLLDQVQVSLEYFLFEFF